MRWALDYTAQQASGIAAWQRDTEHIEKTFVYSGMPARGGVTAVLLVELGSTGVDDGFSGADNFFLAWAPKADTAKLIAQLGERYEITRTTIKLADCTRLREHVKAVRGTVENPMTRDEVVAKCRDLFQPVLRASTSAKLIQTVLELEKVKNLRELRPLLQPA